jgi:SAM-dependent methyltransferase
MARTGQGDHESGRPPAILTWGASALESRVPRLVRTLRATRDRTLGWRDSYAYRHYPEPGKPFGARYRRNHRAFIASALADSTLLDLFHGNRQLPTGHGVGLDERVVEFPWVLASRPSGRVLDAGSALNHPHVLDAILPLVGELTICTLAPEPTSFPERGVSYVYADLRDLPFRDGWFDTVVSVSTLEHVGMDVRRWGAAGSGTDDPRVDVKRAGAELRRVTRRGGRLLLTVPYGAPEDLGWLRQLDRDELEHLVASIGPRETSTRVFAYERRGWRVSSLDGSSGARYQAGNRPAADPDREDLAPAARAVACLELTV